MRPLSALTLVVTGQLKPPYFSRWTRVPRPVDDTGPLRERPRTFGPAVPAKAAICRGFDAPEAGLVGRH